MATSPGVRPPTLAQQAYVDLREWLISGALAPGDKLSLRTVAEHLGVSMMPVRSAVSRLVADAALEVLPNRAVCVPVLSLPEFRELTIIRLGVEGFAAERAALLRTPGDLARMRRFDAEFRAQCDREQPDAAAAVKANQSLHYSVYRSAGLPVLMSIIEGLWLRIGPVLNLDMRGNRQRLRAGGAERCHAELITAIERQDAKAASVALVADITAAAAYIESRGVLPTMRPHKET